MYYTNYKQDNCPFPRDTIVSFDIDNEISIATNIKEIKSTTVMENNSSKEIKPYTKAQNNVFNFVRTGTGNGIINAVAGAGKTTTLIGCVDHLSKDAESNCLYCAFNKKIQEEISRKFKEAGHNLITVKTIHALGYNILKDRISKSINSKDNKYKTILNTPEFFDHLRPTINKILKLYDYLTIEELKEIESLKEEGLSWEEKNKFNEGKKHVKKIKERLLNICDKYRLSIDFAHTMKDGEMRYMSLDEFRDMVCHYSIFSDDEMKAKTFSEELKLYKEANEILLTEGNSMAESDMIIDYIDMLYIPNLKNYEPIYKYDYIFVDECQDLSKAQLMIVAKYLKVKGRLIAVGDPYQSIYGFAGADAESYDRIKKVFKATELKLSHSFRCPEEVVKIAREICPVIESFDHRQGITQKIKNEDIMKYIQDGDMIISRRRTPILKLAFLLIDREKEINIHPDEVDEIIEPLKNIFLYDELNIVLTSDIEYENIKKNVLDREMKKFDKENANNPDEAIRKINRQNFEDDLYSKLDFIAKKRHDWTDMKKINDIIHEFRKRLISKSSHAIRLSTIHRAKGLENDRVFILDYDKLPEIRLNQKEWEIKQEKNLKYVAVTRAKKELYMVQSQQRVSRDEDKSMFASLNWEE